jgi:preprotein translocase subunit SecA
MRLFGSDRIAGIMSRLGLEEGQQLEHRWLNRSIESAQRRVEQQNFAYRKRTLEYDNVMNKQREVIYGLRGDIVRAAAAREHIYDILHDLVLTRAETFLTARDEAGPRSFAEWIQTSFPIPVREADIRGKGGAEQAADFVFHQVKSAYDLKVSLEDPEMVGVMERQVVLYAIDSHWQDYLRSMDVLRQSVGLRAYGQRDPLIEYKKEAFEMFGELMDNIKQEVATSIFRSSTSAASFRSFLENVPRRLVHDQVSLLSGGQPGAATGGGGPSGRRLPDDILAHRTRRPRATHRRSAGTILAPAGAARSTRNATAVRETSVTSPPDGRIPEDSRIGSQRPAPVQRL